jgi:uncharacterized protein (DUF1778 family)
MTEKSTTNDGRVVISIPATNAQVDLVTKGADAANLNLNDFILSTMIKQAQKDLLPIIENRP